MLVGNRLKPGKNLDFEFRVKRDAYIAALVRNFGFGVNAFASRWL